MERKDEQRITRTVLIARASISRVQGTLTFCWKDDKKVDLGSRGMTLELRNSMVRKEWKALVNICKC